MTTVNTELLGHFPNDFGKSQYLITEGQKESFFISRWYFYTGEMSFHGAKDCSVKAKEDVCQA